MAVRTLSTKPSSAPAVGWSAARPARFAPHSALSASEPPGSSRHEAPYGRQARPAENRRVATAKENRDDGRLSVEALAIIAAGLAQTTQSGLHLQQWAVGKNRRYARLLETELYEAWLIDWSASSGLDMHDHGGSVAAVHVVAGRLIETYSDPGHSGPLQRREVSTGGSFTVPVTRVHEIVNPGPNDALSVHVYSPRLASMTFFERNSDGILTPVRRADGELADLEEDTPRR